MSIAAPDDPPIWAVEAIDLLIHRAQLDGPNGKPTGVTEVSAAELDEPFRELLTQPTLIATALERKYERPTELHVMGGGHGNDERYSRKTFLTAECDDVILAYGMLKMDTRSLPAALCKQLSQAVHPLGRLLEKHKIAHEVKTHWFVRFERGSTYLTWFGTRRMRPPFGRVCSVEVEGRRAAELLEIVTGDDPSRR